MRARAWFFAPIATVLFAAAWPAGCSCNDSNPNTGGGGQGAGGAQGGGGSGTGGIPLGGGGTASTGGGGTGGAGGTNNDICPGTPVTTAVNTQVTVNGTTTAKGADYQEPAPCADTSQGADVVYAFTPGGAGVLHLTLTPAQGYDAAFYARTACRNDASYVFCNADPGTQDVTFPVAANTTYFTFVDGVGTQAGDFSLKFDLKAPQCGDGYVNPPEQCDLGTFNGPGSGCNSDCTLQPVDDSDACPGAAPVTLNSGVPFDLGQPPNFASTANFNSDY